MYFQDKHAQMVYILVYANIHIGNEIDISHCVCDVLNYNTETWWSCDDETITKYSGYPYNVYDNLSNKNEQRMHFLSFECIRKDCVNVIHKRRYCTNNILFCTGKSVSKDIKNIKDRIAEFTVSNKKFEK